MAKIKGFLEFCNEEVHPKVLGALQKAPQNLVLPSVIKAHRTLRAQGQDPGLAPGKPESKSGGIKPAKGSSRAVLGVKKPHKVVIDGEEAHVKSIVKMAYQGRKKINVGVEQNKIESHPNVQKHSVLKKQRDGSFKFNKKGVVPPVFSVGNNHSYLHAGHADGLPGDERKFREIMKTRGHPNGMSQSAFLSAVGGYGSDKDMKHPQVKKFHEFKARTGISDFHNENFGVWTHPHSGEKHIVLRDAGFDDSMKKHYDWGKRSKGIQTIQRKAKFKSKQKLRKVNIRPLADKNQGKLDLDNPNVGKIRVVADTRAKYQAALGQKHKDKDQAKAQEAYKQLKDQKVTHTPGPITMIKKHAEYGKGKIGVGTRDAHLRRFINAKRK